MKNRTNLSAPSKKTEISPDALCDMVLAELVSAEMEALAFASCSGKVCPPSCGECCRLHNPEDSVLALLPAARWLIARPEVSALIERAETDPPRPCLFFDPREKKHCSIYPLRPLVCRLFGFAGKRDKYDRIVYHACAGMESAPGAFPLPCPPFYVFHMARVQDLYPPLGFRLLPLNQAFREAAGWLQSRIHYTAEQALGPGRPSRPRRVPKAA